MSLAGIGVDARALVRVKQNEGRAKFAAGEDEVPADADADAVGDESPTTVGAGLEMLAPAFIQLGLGETQAIVQVRASLDRPCQT